MAYEERKYKFALTLTVILILIFIIPIYPTVKWALLPSEKRELAELKYEAPEKYKALPPEKRKEIDKLKKLKNKAITLGLDLQGGMHIVLEADLSEFKDPKDKKDAINRALEVLRNRIDQFGVSEPIITRQGNNRIVVELPGVKDPRRAERLLNVRGKLEFRLVDDELSSPENFTNYKEGILKSSVELPEDEEILFVWAKNPKTGKLEKKYPLVVKKIPELTGAHLKTAGVGFGELGSPVVLFELKPEGADIFYEVTSKNIGKRLAIVLDDKIRSAPVIRAALRGSGQIEGKFTVNEAKDLALILRAGAIPVKLKIVERRIIGPSLGEDSIQAGVKAAIIGMALVIIFMLVYYRLAGVVSVIALLLNLYFLVATLIWLGFTLTLPGLAGIVLTIGMAVDANVLIFERIKEELRTGKSLVASIDAGFEKAFKAIFDANITTLITSFILAQFGTGPIKGFAVTLIIGLLANLYTAVYLSHAIFNYTVSKLRLKIIKV